MQITGTGITALTVRVLPDYRPRTALSIQWITTGKGRYQCTDRGATADVYEAEINTWGTESAINTICEELQDNRQAYSNAITLGGFATDELIFGADVDHTGNISAVVADIGVPKQTSWKGYSLWIRFRALSPTFSGNSSLPTLKWCDVGSNSDISRAIKRNDSYTGVHTFNDSLGDSRLFKSTFTLSTADMQILRRYIATNRGNDYTLSDTFGAAKPFGPESAGSYPYYCKLIEWEDLGLFGLKWWRVSLTFAEVV
jgi:hypothetical protein